MNCKPGDLAIVIGADQTPEMIGRIVRVVRPAVDGESVGHSWIHGGKRGLHYWVIKSVGPEGLPTRTTDGKFAHLHQRPFSDRYLRPISGLPDTEDTDEREPIKEAA